MKKKVFLKILIPVLFFIVIFLGFNHSNLFKVGNICLDIYKRPTMNLSQEPDSSELLKTYIKLLTMHKTNLMINKKDDLFIVKNFLGFKQLYYDNIIPIRCLFKEIYIDNIYSFVTDKKDPFIIDCGSNRGMSVLYFKRLYPNAKMLAFEPLDKAFKVLRKNVENNSLKSVTLIKEAVSNKVGKIKFYVGDETIDESFNFEKGHKNSSEYYVSSNLLSNYIKEEVDLLKLDIEASELNVMEDLVNNNKLKLIKEIVMEYHQTPNLKGNKLSKLMTILEENNFSYQIGNGSINPHDKQFPKCFCIIHAYRMD